MIYKWRTGMTGAAAGGDPLDRIEELLKCTVIVGR